MVDLKPVVYVVDDDPAACASVAALVRARGLDAREFFSAESFLEAIRAEPDPFGCLVVDVRMRGMSGLELQKCLTAEGLQLPVILITAFADVPMAVRAVQGGAVDFLPKPCNAEKLWQTITSAIEQGRAERQERGKLAPIRQRLDSLSPDERQVLAKVLAGLPNKRIARDLDIGLRTVELRRANLMKKMQVDSLAELIQLAILAGFSLTDDEA